MTLQLIKFKEENKTFKRIQGLNPQIILRYGATFDEKYHNLMYKLNSIEAFNNDLVKGINAYVEEFKEGENTVVRLVTLEKDEATFEIKDNGKERIVMAKRE